MLFFSLGRGGGVVRVQGRYTYQIMSNYDVPSFQQRLVFEILDIRLKF